MYGQHCLPNLHLLVYAHGSMEQCFWSEPQVKHNCLLNRFACAHGQLWFHGGMPLE